MSTRRAILASERRPGGDQFLLSDSQTLGFKFQHYITLSQPAAQVKGFKLNEGSQGGLQGPGWREKPTEEECLVSLCFSH